MARMVLHPRTSEEEGWGIVALFNQRLFQQVPRTYAVVDGIVGMLQGSAPPAAPFNPVMILYRGIMVLAVLQLIGMGWSARALRRWRQQPASQRRPAWLPLLWRLALPVGLHALVALIFLVALPTMLYPGASRTFIVAADPDVGYVMAVSGGLALRWSIIHTIVALALLRRQGPSARATSPLPA
jgi:hypothetical protein